MTSQYPDTMTLAEARSLFFAWSGLGDDGGYNARWVRVETKPFPVYFPNTRSRVEAAKLHDLHHIANGYATNWAGEAEIAAWEIASGCGHHLWAWFLNLGAFTVGIFLFPRRLFDAFIRGGHSTNLYRAGFPESDLSSRTVGWLRERLEIDRNPPAANTRDKLAFAFWAFTALGHHGAYVIVGLAIVWWIATRLAS
jgi:hypothetical protein